MPNDAPTWDQTEAIETPAEPIWEETSPDIDRETLARGVETQLGAAEAVTRMLRSPTLAAASEAGQRQIESQEDKERRESMALGGSPFGALAYLRPGAEQAGGAAAYRQAAALPGKVAVELANAALTQFPRAEVPGRKPRFMVDERTGELRQQTPQEFIAEGRTFTPGQPVYQPRDFLHPSDLDKILQQATTPESLLTLPIGVSGTGAKVLLFSMVPGLAETVSDVVRGRGSEEDKRDRINSLVVPALLGLSATRPKGMRLPELPSRIPPGPEALPESPVPPPLEFTGAALPGRPAGATPLRPTPGPEPLGPQPPRRGFPVEVPGTPAEARVDMVTAIRNANARTRGEIKRLFPKAEISGEDAAALRDLAFPEDAGERAIARANERRQDLIRRGLIQPTATEQAIAEFPRPAAPETPPEAPPAPETPPGPPLPPQPPPTPPAAPPAAPQAPAAPPTPPAAPTAAAATPGKPEVAKLGTGTARINQFGDPATTIYHATPEDWEAWKALKAQYEAIRGNAALTPSQKVVEMQKLGAENERIRNKYGGMDPQPPKAAPEPAAPPAPTAPAAPAAHPAATIAASVEGWQFDGEKGGYTIGKVTVPKQWSFTRTVEGQKTTLLINADTPPAEIQARLNAKAAEFKTEPAAPAAAAAPTAPEREWLGKPLSYWDTLTDPANLPKGDERARLAKSLGVPNMPGKIVQHIKRRVAEIRAKPEAPPAPPEPVRPAEAPPMTRADAERIVKEVEARRQKVIDWMRKAQDVQDKLEMGKELTDEELTFAKGHIEGEDEGPEPNTYEQLAEYKRALAVLGRPDQFTPPPGAPPAPTPPSQLLFVKSGNRMRQVSAKEASAMMDRIRAETGKGASELGRLILYNSKGNPIGHVSYNGNVWYGTGANPDLIHNATGLVKDAQGRWGIPEGPRWKELTEVQDKLDQFRKKHAAFSDASLAADYPEFAALIKQRDAILKERHGAGAGGTIDVTAQAKPIEPPPPAAPAEAPPPVTPPPAALPSPAKPAAAAPAAQTATARIANIFNRWDQGDESVTERDVLKQVEDEIAAGEKLPKPLVKAAQKYRAALQEDIAMAGRGEVEPAQEAFMSQVEKLAPAEPVTAAKLQSEVTKVANTEGQRPAKEVKSELVQRVEAEIAALPELKGEVEFGKPRSYEGVKKIKVLKIGEPGNGTLEIVEGRSGLWKVVVSDYFAGVKTPIYRSQVLQSDMPLAEAKEYAREQMLSGNPFHVDKPVLEGEKLKKEITVDWSKWPTDEHPIRQAPDTVTIDIPGDGTFTVPKTRFALERMLKRAKALDTKPGETKAEEQRLAKQRGTPPAEPGISVGPGAASPAEFAERPDPEVMGINIGSPVWNKITRGWRNLIEGIRQLHSRSGQKQDIMMMANEAHNLPYMTGQQAGNSLRLRTKPEERTALTFLMQSLKMSGQGLGAEAEARLGLLEHAGDPIGYLRAKQTDLETAAQDFNRRGLKLEAQAAIEAAKAMRYARQNFNRLKSLADLAKRKFDLQLRREDRAGIHTDYENWYVPQRHELDLFTSGDRPIILGHSRAGGIGTNFKKAKVFEDYASAIEAGFVPRSLDIGDLLEHRVTQGERIIARKTFYDGMRTITDPVDGKPVVISIPKRKVTRPDGTVETQESVPLDYAAHEVIPGYRVAVHKGYDRLVNALTARSQLAESAAVGLLQDIAAVEKHIGLALDTFHASRTLQAEAAITGKLSLGARQRLGRALVEYNLADLDAAVAKGEITQEMADYIQTRQPMQIHGRTVNVSPSAVLRFGARNGLNVGRFADALYRQFLRDFPITGTVNKWVFDKMTRSAISHSFIAEFERVGKARPDLTAQQVARTVARDINVLFGNLQKESIFRNPSLRSIMQILFLAPQWVEALTRREARTVLQLGKLPIDVMRGRPVHLPTTAKAVGTGLAAYVVATQVANLITRGQLTFFNPEEGHKLDAWIPGGPRGFFISPLSVFGEITHDVIRYAQTKPDIATALQQIGANKLGNLGRFLDIAVLGRDPLSGEKIIGTARRAVRAAIAAVPVPITLSQGLRAGAAAATGGAVPAPPPGAVQRQIMSSAGFKTEPVPSAQTRIYQLVDRWKMQAGPKYRAEVERRQKEDFGPSDYGPLRQALAAGRLNAARDAYRDLRNQGKTPRTIDQTISKPHPFTGSRVAEAAFMQTLTPEQREIYRQALEERKQLLQQFRQMQSTR